MPARLTTLLTLAALVVGLAAACGDDDAAGDGRPIVAATTSILGDVVSQVAGEDVEVRVLIPAGVDPHGFAPSAREAAELREVDLVVANGLGLEGGLGAALEAAGKDGVRVLEVAPLVDPIPFGDHDGHDDEGDGHDHDGDDPHFWHDPLRMAAAVPHVADALAGAVPSLDVEDLAARADRVVAELQDLDAEVAAILDAVPPARRVLVTNHDTLGYLGDRYDFDVVGVLIPGGDTLARPSAQQVAALAQVVADRDVPAIFAETVAGTGLAETLAEAAGGAVAIVELHTDALGEPGSGADTYAGLLRANAMLIADALD